MVAITLYHFPPSAPSRAALLVARALGLEIEVQKVDLFTKEQLKPDFVKVHDRFWGYVAEDSFVTFFPDVDKDGLRTVPTDGGRKVGSFF